MPTPTEELRQKRADVIAKARKIVDKGDEDKRDLTGEEQQEFERHMVEAREIKANYERRESLEAEERDLSRSAGRKTDPTEPGGDMPGDRELRHHKPIECEFRGKKLTIQPGTPAYARATSEYIDSFRHYIRTGREDRAMSVGDQAQGGYFVPMQMSMEILTDLNNEVWMRQLSTVLPPLITGASLGVLSRDARPGDGDWTPEIPASDLTPDTAIRIGARELMPHLDTKYIEVSQKLLRVSVVNVEQYVRDEMLYIKGITEEQAMLTGDGAQQPLGVFTASADGVTTSQDVTAAATTTVAADDFKTVKWDFPSQYRNNLSWVMHRDLMEITDKLKTGDGQYLLKPGLAEGAPDTILGYPVFTSEYAPNTFTTGLYVALLGNFRRGYRIVDSLTFEIQRLNELKTLQNKTGFKMSHEVDGQPVLADAFRRLKLA